MNQKVYNLPSRFWPYLVAAKLIGFTSSYAFVWMLHFGDATTYGSAGLFWASLFVMAAINICLFRFTVPTPENHERLFLISLAVDIVTASYLFLPQPQMILIYLIALMVINSFYNFVLPRSTGTLLTGLSILIYGFSIMLARVNGDLDIFRTNLEAGAYCLIGLGAMATSTLLVRKIKRNIDEIYQVSEDLVSDLSLQAINADLAVESLVERNREVQTLLQILENIISVLDWEELFGKIVEALRNRFDFDKFSIYIYNQDEQRLELKVESGDEAATGVARSVKLDQGVVGWSFTNREGVLIDDVLEDKRWESFNQRGKKIRSLACMPLMFRQEALGVLCLDSHRIKSFDADAFAFLQSIAPLISIAVSNSLNYTTVKTESHTDNLTQLNNHGGFMEKFIPMLNEAYCKDIPLGLIYMDIDHFKSINDTYGHLVGNLVIQELSQILKTFFRGTDLVGRWGGEEFAVVLKGTPPEIAPRIAEQLRRKVEAHQFPISLQRDAFKQVTISIGLATTADTNLKPEVSRGSRSTGEGDVFLKNVEEISALFVDNADHALYTAKNSGRNQVMLSKFFPIPQNESRTIEIRS
ncbi:sensor domain-containing diguanylate cyclase [bacterium]|nr:sensor domain-containing diguanylate cyclase [bacterium]